jgi:hypothetical protein
LRHGCPAQSTSSPLDVKLAESLLADPARYSAALGAIHAGNTAQLGAALTGGGSGLSSAPRTP